MCEGGDTQIKWKLEGMRVGIQCYLLCPEQRWSYLHWGRQVEWLVNEGTTRNWMQWDDCG